MKVTAYRNLKFKEEVRYSIRTDGRVIETRPSVVLSNCTFKHASADQIHRCRFGGAKGTGCREVCQWVSGEIVETSFTDSTPKTPLAEWRSLLCDPRKHDGFRDEETGKQIDSAVFVYLSPTGAAFYIP